MQSPAIACQPTDTVHRAAGEMLRHDCGAIPVVLAGSGRLCGIVTDRDICMAAYRSGRCLDELPVGEVMTRRTRSCWPEDDVSIIHDAMRELQVRRMPVTDDDGRLVGIVSLTDLVLAAADAEGRPVEEITTTLAEVCRRSAETAPDRPRSW